MPQSAAGRYPDTEAFKYGEIVNIGVRAGDNAPTAAALGFFDGVHLGHTAVIEMAARQKLRTAVVTFSHNPGKTENGGAVPEITCRALKEKIFESLSVDTVVYFDFEKVRNMEPRQFIGTLCRLFPVKYISSGYNYRFGKNAAAGVRELEAICAPLGIQTGAAAPVCVGKLPMSSTRIRALVGGGNVREAAKLLGRPFAIYGEVVHGRQLGRTLGTPTVNQLLPPPQLLPRFGVYASFAHVEGSLLPSVTNVGVKPTISDSNEPVAETNIIGLDGDLYGKIIQVDLMEFLRPEIHFAGLDELKAQMRKDTEKAKELLKTGDK